MRPLSPLEFGRGVARDSNPLPYYMRGKAVLEVVQVPNSVLSGSPGQGSTLPGAYGSIAGFVNAENGAAWDRRSNEIWMFGGGHSDWGGNQIASFKINNAPGWVLRRDRSAQADITNPTSPPPRDPAFYADGRPCSRHTYSGSFYVEKIERYMAIGGYSFPNINGFTLEPVTFDSVAGDWEPQGTWNTGTLSTTLVNGLFAKHPTTEDIYFGLGGLSKLYKLDTSTKVWSTISASISIAFPGFECSCIDPTRNAFVVLTTRGGAGSSQTYMSLFSLTSGARTNISINASAAWTAFQGMSTDHGGIVYDNDLDVFYYLFGGSGAPGRVFRVTPNGGTTWDMDELALTGASIPQGGGTVAQGNMLTKWGYATGLKALWFMPSFTSGVYVARTQ